MKTTKEKKARKHMSKTQKKAIVGVATSILAPFTGIGPAIIMDSIRDTIEEQKATEKAIEEDEKIGKECDELIAKRKAEANEVEETEEDKETK